MIIFDLDGTLADCEHRRHLVDPKKRSPNGSFMCEERGKSGVYVKRDSNTYEPTNEIWKPDWKAFYEACEKDLPIEPVIRIFHSYYRELSCPITKQKIDEIQIWSGRCESVRWKTEHWLFLHGFPLDIKLKMRPIGDNTPDEVLKERKMVR